MDGPGARWSFLRAWCAPLRALSASADRGAVRFRLPPATDAQRLREAALLLALLARVDAWAWAHVLRAHCGVRLDAQFARDARAAFVVDASAGCLDGLQPLLLGDAAPSRQQQWALAAKQILARGIAGRVDFRGERLDVPVELCVRAGDGAAVEELREIVAALRARHSGYRFPVSPHEEIASLDSAFVLGGIDLDMGDLDKRMASAVEQLAKLGGLTFSRLAIPIHIVESSCAGKGDGENILVACRMNERLLCSAGDTNEMHSELQSVKLKTRDGYNHVSRLLTAVADAQRLASVEIDINMVEAGMSTGTWLWEWLAYALFSSDASARSSITSVTLNNVFLTEIDAAAVAGVLRSANPLNWVINRNRRDSLNIGRLKQGSTIKLLSMRPSEHLPNDMPLHKLEYDIDGVKLLPDTSDTPTDRQRIVVPGYGICEVCRGQVVAGNCGRRPGTEVISLKLQFEFSHEAVEGLGRFLPLVGRSLAHLEIFMHRALRVPLPVILRSCPQLKSLILRDATINSAEFVEEYAYTMQQLEEIDCCITDARPLANELADPTSGLAASMKRLDCRLVGPAHRLNGEQLRSVAVMLEANKTIEFVRLTIPRSLYNAEDLEDVLKFHQEMLPIARKSFPMACRLAFLSVFTSRGDGEHEQKRRAIASFADTVKSSADLSKLPIIVHAFERIFAFAAENVQRVVHVNCDGAWFTSFPSE